MDTNKDHVVDKEEFKSAGGTDEEFDRYDTNKDRKLDAGELSTRAAAKAQAAADMDRMDTNKDHVVDKEEFKAAGGTDEEFDRYDTNKDRKLDAGEMEQRAADKVEEQERARVARAGPPGLSWRGEMLNNTTVC